MKLLTNFIFISLLIVSCKPKSNKVDLTGNQTTITNPFSPSPVYVPPTTPSPTTPPNPTYPENMNSACNNAGVGTQSIEYYRLPNIVGHGIGSNGLVWSSQTVPALQGANLQDIFYTDSRLKIRPLVYPSPGKGTDSYGNECRFSALPYTKLRFKVGVKAANATAYYETFTFDSVGANNCAAPHSFNVPPTNGPVVVEVLDVQWDYTCHYYTSQGVSSTNDFCPWDYVWVNDCFEIQLQMSTDYTKDFQ